MRKNGYRYGMLVGRLAPSPTGSLHLGNVRSFLWAWLSVRARGGHLLLRIEDLEKPAKPGVSERMLDELHWLGFDWDSGPDLQLVDDGPHAPYTQSLRRDDYRSIFDRLHAAGVIYPCVCSRQDIAAAQSAPHDGDAEARYPGTCRARFASMDEARAALADSKREPAWRVKADDIDVCFDDLLYGPQTLNVQSGVGDFIVFKTRDTPGYQLAVVADDIAMGVTEVVRGDDLIPSTARQILLYRLLGATPPTYGHAPLLVGADGRRLAKRHGDSRIATLRGAGVPAAHIIGTLARWSGLNVDGPAMPRDLIGHWDWARVNRERVVLTPERLRDIESPPGHVKEPSP